MTEKRAVVPYKEIDEIVREEFNGLSRDEQLSKLREMAKEAAELTEITDSMEHKLVKLVSYIENYRSKEQLTFDEQKELNDKTKEYSQLQQEFSTCEKRRMQLEEKIALFQKIVRGDKSFNKWQLFQNIRELANSKNIKLGQIERDASCQPGYMSRLEKVDNITDPTVEFIVTAARELEVPVDLLIFSKFSGLSPTEQYVLKFINQLIKDTVNDEMRWIKENMRDFSPIAFQYKSGLAPFHPVFKCDRDDFDEICSVSYKSSFFPAKIVTPIDNCYYGDLKGSDAQIYIMHCRDSVRKKDTSNEFFEVYISRAKRENPIFCTLQTCDAIASATEILYKGIEAAATHIHINDEAKDIINLYFNPKPL